MRFLLCAAMTATLLAAGPAAGQDESKLYKWVDEDGNVTYQDRPPPDEARPVQTFEQPLERSAEGEQDIELPDVDLTLYSIEACDACDLVRNLLNDRGLPFTEKDAEQNVEVQDELREVSGVLSVPVLVIGDEVLTGFNRDLILRVLSDAGFPTDPGARARAPESSGEEPAPDETDQAGGDASPDGEETDSFEEDIFSGFDDAPLNDDISQWEEIPEDEQIRVGE
ncbi:MAG: glutaredoxin family protein [Gammaproteobacteria bacterium]|nr:glutaredoxin family protein [Gammaproteobacteria bacterium]